MKRKKQLIPILLEFSHVNAGDDVYVRTQASWNDCSIVSTISGRSSFAGWKLS